MKPDFHITYPVILIAFLFLILTPTAYVQAADEKPFLMPDGLNCSIDGDLPACVKSIYRIGVGAVAILAVIVIMWGGIVWLTSGGNVSQIESAKNWISGSILGLVLALTSFVILNTINPQLIQPKIRIVDFTNGSSGEVCCKFITVDKKIHYEKFQANWAGKNCENVAPMSSLINLPAEAITEGPCGAACLNPKIIGNLDGTCKSKGLVPSIHPSIDCPVLWPGSACCCSKLN